MAIKTYSLQAKIDIQTLYGDTEDITKGVKTLSVMRSINPPYEKWNMSMKPIRDEKGRSWYHKISPNDYIKIKFARTPKNWNSNLKTYMHGLVDAVNYSASVDGKGAPIRSYDLHGSGLIAKLLDITKIYYLFWEAFTTLLQNWGLIYVYNSKWDGPPAEIMEDLFKKLIRGTECKTQWEYMKQIYTGMSDVEFVAAKNILGNTNVFSVNQFQGSVGQLLRYFLNYPWNELYPTQFGEDPKLVFRATPWKDADGRFIQFEEADINETPYKETLGKPIKLTFSDIISVDINRSDAEVRNCFFTYPQNSLISSDSFRATTIQNDENNGLAGGRGNPYIFDDMDPDCGKNRFGFRYHEFSTPYVYLRADENIEGQAHGGPLDQSFCSTINRRLAESARRNADYENGVFVLKGNENIFPGMYIKIQDAEYYVNTVQHVLSFTDKPQFQSTCHVTRGTGYIEMKKSLGKKLPTGEIFTLKEYKDQ